MRKFSGNIITLIIALIGFVGGIVWGYFENWDYEPIILLLISTVEIVAFLVYGNKQEHKTESSDVSNNQTVSVNLNFESTSELSNKPSKESLDRNAKIEALKPKVRILFIDDDTKFNVVKILKDSGWKNTKTVIDIKSIDVPQIQNSDIIFIDINGVGKVMNLEHEGLDLALMIKKKYSEKKVVIYSAKRDSNSFHKAWDIVDSRLEKNALPFQFTNLVDIYSLELYG